MIIMNYVIKIDDEIADLVGIPITNPKNQEKTLRETLSFVSQWCGERGIGIRGVKAKPVSQSAFNIWKSFFEKMRG